MARDRSRTPPRDSECPACSIEPVSFRGRQAVRISNDLLSLTIFCGGGHLALLQFSGESAGAEHEFGSPLWVPPWSTVDPSVVAAAPASEFGESLEGTRLLPHIAGHSLCLDVFGEHSKGEEKFARVGLHGEAGHATWEVISSHIDRKDDCAKLTMAAHLRHSSLEVSRTFSLVKGERTISVTECVKNLVGFERAFGRANHVTLGAAFLRDGKTTVTANLTHGKTFPDCLSPKSTFATNSTFDYPNVPALNDGNLDWRCFPRTSSNLDLCTCTVDTASKYGWMCAHNCQTHVALCYVWERASFPWLTSWEENFATEEAPWNGRTLARGLEFTSYAFPTSRRINVETGQLFGVPTFEWLDAYEEKKAKFWIALQKTPDKSPKDAVELRQGLPDPHGVDVFESDVGVKLRLF